jgi:hypothetical protein
MKYSFTIQQLQALRSGLLRLLEEGPRDTFYGVCYNLNRVTDFEAEAYSFMQAVAWSWPHSTLDDLGPKAYFVPEPEGVPPWEGRSRVLRENLMGHALDVIDLIIGGEYPYAELRGPALAA